MFPPFPEEKAFEQCRKIFELIEQGKIVLKTVGRKSQERSENGVMIGCLVCLDENGNERILRTVSGNSRVLENAPNYSDDAIFVGPIVSTERIDHALKDNDEQIHLLTERINSLRRQNVHGTELDEMVQKRKALCAESLENVHQLYSFYCADGKTRSLREICSARKITLSPTGTGDCCAPKLLDFAFRNKWRPVSMCEMYFGKSSQSSIRIHGNKYSPCDERCGIILPAMLGIEIIYRDKDILVVNKQSGLLSVPGRGPDKQDCIVNRMRNLFPESPVQCAVHRLDMETSGIMILSMNLEAHRKMVRQFEEKEIQKEYIAVVDGVLSKNGIPDQGQNELYFRLDVDNRPHQIWDPVYGKKAITEWKILGVENYVSPDGMRRPVTRVLFMPHTGRTHQLRLVSSDSHGFGCPIIGDTLYGKCQEGERLLLHAKKITFAHPSTGQTMVIETEVPF